MKNLMFKLFGGTLLALSPTAGAATEFSSDVDWRELRYEKIHAGNRADQTDVFH